MFFKFLFWSGFTADVCCRREERGGRSGAGRFRGREAGGSASGWGDTTGTPALAPSEEFGPEEFLLARNSSPPEEFDPHGTGGREPRSRPEGENPGVRGFVFDAKIQPAADSNKSRGVPVNPLFPFLLLFFVVVVKMLIFPV